jgi:hypothetical protein
VPVSVAPQGRLDIRLGENKLIDNGWRGVFRFRRLGHFWPERGIECHLCFAILLSIFLFRVSLFRMVLYLCISSSKQQKLETFLTYLISE